MKFLLPLLLLLTTLCSFGQSESNDFVTYDSAMNLVDARTGQVLPKTYLVKVWRPRDYFTTDTSSRLVIIFHEGLGEVQQGSPNDSTIARRYGPFYWLVHGWDGGVVLGNGKHYPIIITPIPPQGSPSVPPQYTLGLYRALKTIFHPRGGTFLCAGLSQGGYHVKSLILYSNNTPNNPEAMKLVRCFADLQGVGPDYTANDYQFPAGFATWAGFGGRYWASEGTQDSRNLWQISQAMNAAVPNSGYFAYANYGGGSHGGTGFDGISWNWNMDPAILDWHCLTPPALPSGIAPSSSPANTMGNYYVDAVRGTSVLQWMLRQATDTSLIGSANPIANAGGDRSVQLPTNSTTLTGTASAQGGHTVLSTVWSKVSGPNNPTFGTPNALTTTLGNLVAGTYVIALTVTDNVGLVTQDNLNVIVSPTVSPTVSAGSPISIFLPTTSANLTGTATGNGGATITTTIWAFVSGPTTPSITNGSTLTPTITGMSEAGNYVFRLTATDNNGNVGSSTVTVTVFNGTIPITGAPPIIIGTGEYQCFGIDRNGLLWGWGNKNTTGTGGNVIPPIAAKLLVTPVGLKFKYVAGGLHGGIAIDTARFVWCWGQNDGGQCGVGTSGPEVTTPVRIPIDSLNNPFVNITGVVSYYVGNSDPGNIAWKSNNDTFWIWGATRGGVRGDGTPGSAITNRPVPVVMPNHVGIKQIIGGDHIQILCVDSTIWTCGGGDANGNPGNYQNLGYIPTLSQATDYRTLHQIPGITNAIQTAGGLNYNYALLRGGKLKGWGFYSGYMGASNNDARYATPQDLTVDITDKLPALITDIQTNSECTHVILADSTLWGWGDNAQGVIGNGQEIDFSTYPTPYAWSFAPYEFPQRVPVQIIPTRKFIAQFNATVFVYYTYAEEADGTLWSWGRNKGGVLGNGIIDCSSNQAALYPNSHDVPLPTIVNPFTVTTPISMSTPLCKTSPGSTYCPDAGCVTTTGIVLVNVGPGQILSISSSTLPGSASTTAGVIVKYRWTKLTGPSGDIIDNPTAASTTVTNLQQGVYQYLLTATDNNYNVGSSILTVNTVLVPPTNLIIRRIQTKRKYKLVP